jgi:hypothetical protein
MLWTVSVDCEVSILEVLDNCSVNDLIRYLRRRTERDKEAAIDAGVVAFSKKDVAHAIAHGDISLEKLINEIGRHEVRRVVEA